jgi:hypothetical protein
MRTLLAVAIAAVVVATSGCGGSSSKLDPKVASAYVDAQAHALCLVQSTAYPTLAALQAAYTSTLHSTKLSDDELAKARAAEAKDVTLRRRVSDKVAALCG